MIADKSEFNNYTLTWVVDISNKLKVKLLFCGTEKQFYALLVKT